MSENGVVEIILHCQKQIKKDRLPEEKLLHYLGRLSRLRITVQDLAETGIGRTVNSLSRNEGRVGRDADELVRRWKRMVSEQQNQVEQESEEESDSNSGSSEEDEEGCKDNDESFNVEPALPVQNVEVHGNGNRNGHSSAVSSTGLVSEENRDFGVDGDDIDDIDDPYMENGFLSMANVHTDDEEEDEDEGNDHDSDTSDRLQIADEDEHKNRNNIDIKPDITTKQEKLKAYSDEDGDQTYKTFQPKSTYHQPHEEDEVKFSSVSKNHSHHERNEKSHSSRSSSKEHRHHSSKSSSESKDRSKHGEQNAERKSHHQSSSSKHEKAKESKSDEKNPHKDKEKHRSSRDHRHEKHKEAKSEKERKSDREKKESSSHHHSKERTRESGSASSSHSNKKSSPDSKKNYSSEDRKRKEHSDSSSPSSSKKSKLVVKEEIDSTSGINFADALGCLDPTSSKQKKLKKEKDESDKSHRKYESHSQGSSSHLHKSDASKKHESSSSSKHSKDKSSSSSSKHSEKDSERKSKRSSEIKVESVIKPTVTISPNYKPMSSTLATIPRPSNSNLTNGLPPPIAISQADLTDFGPEYLDGSNGGGSYEISQEDAISTMLSNRNKNARSKVYSGVKSTRRGDVPSLYDQCMQVIKDNIGDLGYTGGIPFDILKPALERANPLQLMSIEAQNDYLIGETDELWQFHCRRDFRGKCPDETESWRELYERCKEEQQVRFELVKKKMKKSIASAEPERKAKLAYVDTSCGPRFNLQKAQTIKNGMKTLKIKEEKGPSRGVSSSASAGFNNPKKSGETNNVKVEEASVIIGSESRAGHAPAPSVSRESSAAKLKPRKAPLMQKTMKLIRSLNRR